MFHLLFILHSVIGTTLAGAGVVLALVLGLVSGQALGLAAALGFVLAFPLSWLVAQEILRREG